MHGKVLSRLTTLFRQKRSNFVGGEFVLSLSLKFYFPKVIYHLYKKIPFFTANAS